MKPLPMIGLCITAWSFHCTAAVAQVPPSGESTADEIIIVVQGEARLREAAPASVLPLGAETIERLDLDSMDAVAVAAPGLSMINDQDPGTNIIAMRGVTTDRLQQAAIAYVLDDIPLADTEFFTGPLFDLARIDVLRGPQGALYGKSAAGGAVEVRSRAASSNATYAAISAGNGGLRAIDVAAGAALGEEWAVRAAARWSAANGWITNRTLNRVVDAEESRALRLRAAGPIAGGELDITALHVEEDGGAAWASSGDVTGRFGGKLSGDALTNPIGDFEGRSARRWSQVATRYTAQLNPHLRLTGYLAHDAYKKRWVEELDYRPGPLTFFGAPVFPDGLQPIRQPTDIDATTAQLRLALTLPIIDGGQAVYTFGLFAQDIDRRRIDDFGPLLFGSSPAAYDTDTLQQAAFFSYVLTKPSAAFEINARYDIDDRRQRITDALTRAQRAEAEETFRRLQPRIAGSLRLDGDATGATWIYAAFGEGFRSGGFNPAPTPTSIWRAQFDPEVTRSLEAGMRRLSSGAIMEAIVFGSTISDYQSYTFLDGNSVTLNVDRVEVYGWELMASLRRLPLLGGEADVGVGIAYAAAMIDRYIAPDPLVPGAVRNYSGKRVPNAPLWTGAAAIDWTRDFEAGTLTFGATLNATGDTVYEIDNRLRSPSKQWLDLRASISQRSTRLSVLARNATNERWAISAFGQGMLPLLSGLGPNGPFDTFTLNRGRQISIELRRSF